MAILCSRKHCISVVCGLVVLCTLSTPGPTIYASTFERVQERLVAITCETIDQSDQLRKRYTSSGFFISPLGDIITSFHLLKNTHIKKYDPDHLDCWVSIGSKDSQNERVPGKLRAVAKKHDETHDILHLKVTNGRSDYKYFVVDENPQGHVPVGTTVLTTGFPESLSRNGDTAQITSTQGPEHNEELWVINSEVEQGQSGSPVFLEKSLKVIGVIKGQDKKKATQGYIVPSHHIVRLVPDVKNFHGRDSPAGRLRIEAKVAAPPFRQEVKREWTDRLVEGEAERPAKMCAQPTPGWEIDPKSVKFRPISKSKVSDYPERVESNKECPLLLTGKLIRDTSLISFIFLGEQEAYLEMHVSYLEEQPQLVSMSVYDEDVYPGPLSLKLPDGTQNYKVMLIDPEGKPIGELSGKGENYRLVVQDDGGLKVLSVEVLD